MCSWFKSLKCIFLFWLKSSSVIPHLTKIICKFWVKFGDTRRILILWDIHQQCCNESVINATHYWSSYTLFKNCFRHLYKGRKYIASFTIIIDMCVCKTQKFFSPLIFRLYKKNKNFHTNSLYFQVQNKTRR